MKKNKRSKRSMQKKTPVFQNICPRNLEDLFHTTFWRGLQNDKANGHLVAGAFQSASFLKLFLFEASDRLF
jgi:hypothetical protein